MIKKIIICSLVLGFTMITITSGHNGPVIGILAEELTADLKKPYPNFKSYIDASYVKAVEGSGGRVVPILIGQTEEYYRKQISILNGAVFPGGSSLFNASKGYADAGSYIFKLAIEVNEKGDHFPILGISLGFALLLHLDNGGEELRTNCSSVNIGLPLEFLPGYKHSRLYGKASIHILSVLSSLPVTSNHHEFCITHQNMTKTGLRKGWKILTENIDTNGLVFISSAESISYPFAGIQFNPEKNMYEWSNSQNNPHSAKSILSARHFYDWIVSEARKSEHSFRSEWEMYNALIDNYPRFFTAKQGLHFEQAYLFP